MLAFCGNEDVISGGVLCLLLLVPVTGFGFWGLCWTWSCFPTVLGFCGGEAVVLGVGLMEPQNTSMPLFKCVFVYGHTQICTPYTS